MSASCEEQTCEGCPALCCSDLEEQITRPRNNDEWESLIWQLHFSHTKVFIRNRRWYKLSVGVCMYLDENNRCSIYERRPQTCRDHNPPDCERFGPIYDIMFETPDELRVYRDKEKRKLKRRRKARARR